MRLIGFIIEGAQIRRILGHIEVYSEPPRIWPDGRHAGRRRRMGAMRMSVGVLRPSLAGQPTGTGRRKRYPTLSSISESMGARAKR